jgi:hypothetical protein
MHKGGSKNGKEDGKFQLFNSGATFSYPGISDFARAGETPEN